MAKTKEQKKKIIEGLKEYIKKQKVMIFFDFSGLETKDVFSLKKKLKKVEAIFCVCKKNLLKIVLKEEKIPFDESKFSGQLALILGFKDEILPAKEVYNFEKEHKIDKILGGIFDRDFIEKEKIIELAQIPSKEELLARLVRNLSAPVSNFVNVLNGNIKGLVFVLNAITKSKKQ